MLISSLIVREGGYVDNPADSGGPTKYGITLAKLSQWRHAPVTAGDVQNLAASEAFQIYLVQYFRETGFDHVQDPALQEFLFDFGVNSGPGEAVMCLQRALGVTVDGGFGPQSRMALAAITNHAALFYAVKAERLDFLLRDVGERPSQAQFAVGWSNRIRGFRVPLS